MRIYRGIDNIKELKKQSSCTIGVFDGVHRGHKKIIAKTVDVANEFGLNSVVITFDPHPAKLLSPAVNVPMLISLNHRLALIEEEGVDICVVIDFNEKFLNMLAEDFVSSILINKLKTIKLFVGEDFVFGKDKKGDMDFLYKVAKSYSFEVESIVLEKEDGETISSSTIRNLIETGDLKKAKKFLNRDVAILGTVVYGLGRGHIIGFPTANIDPHHEAIPPSGVYAVIVNYEGNIFEGVANIGVRPTFGENNEPTIEVHLFHFQENLYSKELEVIFLEKIRDEVQFESKEKLYAQIQKDCFKASQILSSYLPTK